MSTELKPSLKSNDRRFPIQQGGTIRWSEAEKAYKTYVKLFGTQQSLERLAERGGFGISEFCCLYLGMSPVKNRESCERIIASVAISLGNNWEI